MLSTGLYQELSLPNSATVEQILAAYQDPKSFENHHQQQAYKILSNPKTKEIYDKFGDQGFLLMSKMGVDATYSLAKLKMVNSEQGCLAKTCHAQWARMAKNAAIILQFSVKLQVIPIHLGNQPDAKVGSKNDA